MKKTDRALAKIDDGYRGRYCRIFFCQTVGDKRCCADCWRRIHGVCEDHRGPCLNDPARCRLEDTERCKLGIRNEELGIKRKESG